jgi:hypothetical protein
VRLYGHVNWGVLTYADGRETNTYAPIDNANSVTRLGVLAERPIGAWDVGGRVEVQYAPYSTFDVNVFDDQADFGTDQGNIRWIEVSAQNDRYGRFSLGQGSMATDGITLIDFADTNVVAYSSVGDSAGGQFLRFTDPTRPIDEPRRSSRPSRASTGRGASACATTRPASTASAPPRPTAANCSPPARACARTTSSTWR